MIFSRRAETTKCDKNRGRRRRRRRRRFGFLFLPLDRREKRDGGKRENEEEEEKERERAPLQFFSLSFAVLFDAFSLLARSREFFSARFLVRSFVRSIFVYSQNNNNSFFLKTQKRRTTRSARRGDETHHETRERNERVGFARVIEGGASRGVLVAATRMAFGVEEFDAQSVAENRVGEIRESTVGVLLRVLSGDISRVGDRG